MSSSDLKVGQNANNNVPNVADFCKEHKFMIGFAIAATILLAGAITAAFITSGQHTTPAFKAEVIAPAIGIPLVCAGIVARIAYVSYEDRKGNKNVPIRNTPPQKKKQDALPKPKVTPKDEEKLLANGANGTVEQIDLSDK